MAGINSVSVTGRLTREPDVRKTPTGHDVMTFSIATEDRKGKASFPNFVAFGQPAKYLGQYAHKGTVCGVDGYLRQRDYTDRDGKKIYITEVVAERVCILAQPKEHQQQTASNDNYGFDTGPQLDINEDDLPY